MREDRLGMNGEGGGRRVEGMGEGRGRRGEG